MKSAATSQNSLTVFRVFLAGIKAHGCPILDPIKCACPLAFSK